MSDLDQLIADAVATDRAVTATLLREAAARLRLEAALIDATCWQDGMIQAIRTTDQARLTSEADGLDRAAALVLAEFPTR